MPPSHALPSIGSMGHREHSSTSPGALLVQLEELIDAVRIDAVARRAAWPTSLGDFEASAQNLASYLALRSHDLRPLQHSLMVLGLSSLGRLESRVMEALTAVRASLAAIVHAPPSNGPRSKHSSRGPFA